MRFFGLEITRAKALPVPVNAFTARLGWTRIGEPFPGAWQRNIEMKFDNVVSNHAVHACATLVAGDISKLRVKLVERDDAMVWTETENAAYSPVLRKPNSYQTRNQFWESYVLSKLLRGNTYVLKQRDGAGIVRALYPLDADRVRPMVATDGSGLVFYELSTDHLSKINAPSVVVPASEIIHDRFNCIFHPLVGVSPIFAAGLAAVQGLNIQSNAAKFFANQAMPGGILTAPGAIDSDHRERLETAWQQNFGGDNRGQIAVLGNGLKFERLEMTSVEAQMIEQLKWSAEIICSVFHVPPYKIGIGQFPPYTDVVSGNIEYYSQALQVHIEAAETALDEGLEMSSRIGTEFDVDNLLRMNPSALMDMLEKARSVMTLDERRARLGYQAIEGGGTIYLQLQDHSLEAIAARDEQLIEAAKNPPAAIPAPADDPPIERVAARYDREFRKYLRQGAA